MYRIKGRDEGKPLAICVGDVDQIQRFDSLLSFIRIIPDLLYYKNLLKAYLAIPVGDIKGLMILKNVLSCFKPSYRSVQISPQFL